jgi:mevalonate kinase
VGVASARGLDPYGDVAARAGAWERVFHGNPSGVDAAVAMLGGCILFERGAPISRVRLGAPLHLCVGHTGQASSTKVMVEAVARQHERRPETTRKTFEAIFTLVKNARLALEAGDGRAVGQLMDLNQMLLSGLFVSTPEIEQMCATARTCGALGAKLTGAGGGGCVIALVSSPSAAEPVLGAWKKDGFDGFFTTAGAAAAVRPRPMEEVAP